MFKDVKERQRQRQKLEAEKLAKTTKSLMSEHDRAVVSAVLLSIEEHLTGLVETQLDRDLNEKGSIGAFIGSTINQQVKIDTLRNVKRDIESLRRSLS